MILEEFFPYVEEASMRKPKMSAFKVLVSHDPHCIHILSDEGWSDYEIIHALLEVGFSEEECKCLLREAGFEKSRSAAILP